MAKTAMQELIEWINERIAYLKKADAEVCATRWDMSKPEFERMMARETSNYLTERRHELEDLLKQITPSLLAQERKQIEDAFGEGRISFSHEIGGDEFEEEKIEAFKSASDYYTKTYNDSK